MIYFELEENSGGRGLPERLPKGERVLWQGAPSWRVLYLRMFHARVMAAYFAVLILWQASSALLRGVAVASVARTSAIDIGLSLVPLALAAIYCWGVQRTTVYTITDSRLVMSYGIALSLSVNLPFTKVKSAGFRRYPGGAGDIPLQLLPGEHVTTFMIWPHARPWRFKEPEPMLRGIADADAVARVLARALAAQAGLAVSVSVPAGATEEAGIGLVAAE